MNQTYLLAVAIGFVAGLRSLTPPAAVSWAACLGWLNLHGSPLAFMGSAVAVALSGVCLSLSAGEPLTVAAVLGGIGAVVGTFAGYQARMRLVSGLKVKDVFVAIPEDLVAIILAYLVVSPR